MVVQESLPNRYKSEFFCPEKVSVIIPVYNVERYISATINSVLNQTYSNFELLIVDDGSPDRSVDICQQFNDPRIRIIRQKNVGLAGARNTGIRYAKGKYLAFLDGDDIWLPEKLEKHILHLEASPNVGISFSRSELIDENGNSLGGFLMPKLTKLTIADFFKGSPIGNGSSAVIRREVFEEIEFSENGGQVKQSCYFDEQFRQSEDIECWLRIIIKTDWIIEGIPEALTLYRVNSQGLSASFFKQLESWENVIQKLRSYAPRQVARWEKVGRAYQLRGLARNAVRLKAKWAAIALIHRSIYTHWRILLEEPHRTFFTLASAYMLWLLPEFVYQKFERNASKALRKSQKNRIFYENLNANKVLS